MSLRATLRGAHEGLAEPLVVEAGDPTVALERLGDGRATLALRGHAGAGDLSSDDAGSGDGAAGEVAASDADLRGVAADSAVGDAAGSEPTRHQVLLAPVDRRGHGAGRQVEVVVDGWRFEVEVEPESRAALRERARRDRGDASHSGPAEVHAIIPGVVVSVAVAPGDTVTAGQQLLVVEAMKMQNELKAPRAGTVERVTVGERSTIEVGDLLVVIE